jgi:hypothetical protein
MVIGMKRTGQTIFSMLVGGALLLSSGTRATAEDSVVDRHEQLLRAVCLNDWDGAIALTGPLIAADKITPSYRQALVELRDQLEEFRVQGTVIPAIDNCEAVLRRYALESQVPGEPLDWAEALNSLFNDGRGAPPPITRVERQENATTVADLDRYEVYEIPALIPALTISLQTGSGVSAGLVSNSPQVFTFFAGLGDRVDIDVDVTRVFPGSLYEDDDTQLFLFDAEGKLLAQNDDFDGLQSRLANTILPRTGRYYVAVTTYNNDPILDPQGYILGWANTGGSALEYTLTISGATPTQELILTNYGP